MRISKIKVPSVLTNDRYVLAQVALYIFSLVLGVTAVFQFASVFAAPDSSIPAGGNRLLMFAVPAVQNTFWTVGLAYFSSKLSDDDTGSIWCVCAGVMVMQIIIGLIVLTAQFNLIPVMTVALAVFGLGSLLVGKEGRTSSATLPIE